ncbi:hypothetical protein A3K73_08170 [Candidatus Pacearchaeota archaeon RBG_13_36_9]|nr:MAG: hypothetical protein A3K73_08170 [Candidatus Pacearchaeota archaeon RBG_13_36_9]
MKILAFSDVQGDIETLERLGERADGIADLEATVCTGNFLGKCLDEKQAEIMEQSLGYIAQRVSFGNVNLGDALTFIASGNPDQQGRTLGKDLQEAAQKYLAVEKKFMETSDETYSQMWEVVRKFRPNPDSVIIVPGYTDGTNINGYFSHFNLHPTQRNNGKVEIADLTFAGVGGSDKHSSFVPQTLRMPFERAAAFEYLSKRDADVAVISPSIYSAEAIRYIDDSRPDLVLYGDSNYSIATIMNSGTIAVCPGRLGKTEDNPVPGFAVIDGKVVDDRLKVEDVKFCEL